MVANRRHKKTSIFCLVQNLNMCPPKVRSNNSHLIAFRPVTIRDKEMIYEYFAQNKKHMNSTLNFFYREPHDFMLMDVTKGKPIFYRNFNKIDF